MPLADWTKKHLDSFLAGIAPIEDAYQEESFSYIAIYDGKRFVVVQGTLYLNIKRPILPLGHFESANVKAGHFLLSEISTSRGEFISKVTEGTVVTPQGALPFLSNKDSQSFGAQFFPFHEVGKNQRRVSMISIHGGDTSEFYLANAQFLDWEVRAAAKPYDGISELLSVFQPGVPTAVARIDIIALEVAAIDMSSTVDGEQAKVMVRVAQKAATDKVSVGYRIVEKGTVVERGRIHGPDFQWTKSDETLVGTKLLAIPKGAVVHGIAGYAGLAQHHYYFGDPQSFLNPLRAAYEAADPKLAKLNETLSKAQSGKVDSRHHEAAISALFWMLGFGPMHIDGLPKMNDAADILLFTPAGHVAVVECTVGMLKEDHKLPGLHERTEAVRRNLDTPSTKHVKILPVIVTSKTAAEIKPDLEQAEKLGVYVVTRETVDRLIGRTMFPPAADALFAEVEEIVRTNLSKYEGFFGA